MPISVRSGNEQEMYHGKFIVAVFFPIQAEPASKRADLSGSGPQRDILQWFENLP